MSCPEYLKLWYSVNFELPMASFFKYICSFFARNFVVGFMLQCFYVPIFLSRLFLRSKSVQKCSTAQSFTFPKFTSFKLGTLVGLWILSRNEVFTNYLYSQKCKKNAKLNLVITFQILVTFFSKYKQKNASRVSRAQNILTFSFWHFHYTFDYKYSQWS